MSELEFESVPNLSEELENERDDLSDKFGTDVSNLLYTLYLDQQHEADDDRNIIQALSNSFHYWWISPHTDKADKIAMLKDPKLWPFTDDETNELKDAINKPAPTTKRKMVFWDHYPAIESEDEEEGDDELEKINHEHHDVVLQIIAAQMRQDLCDIESKHYQNTMLGRNLASLIAMTNDLWEEETTPKHPDVAQLRHLGYGLALTRLTLMDPTIDNARKLVKYSDIVSGKGENVKFNRKLADIFLGIGVGLIAVTLFGTLIAIAIANPATIAAGDLIVNVVGAVSLAGALLGMGSIVAGLYIGDKAKKTGFASNLDYTANSLKRRIKRKHRGPKAPERAMCKLPGKPDDEKLNVRDVWRVYC